MLTEFMIPALLIGVGGSLHCIGMCGPLMFVTLYQKNQKALPAIHWTLYHLGRISIYALWGMLVGLVGASAKWFGVQQNISLAIGIGILVVLITRKVFPSYEKYIAEIGVLQNIRKILIPHINKKTRSASLMGGVVNGLLPCGLVYMSLAGAIAVQEPLKGALFMILFGLGTLPMLLMAMVMGNTLSLATRKFLTQWYPILIGLMAIMLIIRGMNLGHMFSPKLLPGKNAAIHCIGE